MCCNRGAVLLEIVQLKGHGMAQVGDAVVKGQTAADIVAAEASHAGDEQLAGQRHQRQHTFVVQLQAHTYRQTHPKRQLRNHIRVVQIWPPPLSPLTPAPHKWMQL